MCFITIVHNILSKRHTYVHCLVSLWFALALIIHLFKDYLTSFRTTIKQLLPPLKQSRGLWARVYYMFSAAEMHPRKAKFSCLVSLRVWTLSTIFPRILSLILKNIVWMCRIYQRKIISQMKLWSIGASLWRICSTSCCDDRVGFVVKIRSHDRAWLQHFWCCIYLMLTLQR